MIRIAICDDDESLVFNNKRIIGEYVKKNKEIVDIEEYSNGEFLLADIQEGEYFDLILLDIEMPHKDGMEIAPQIKKYLPHALIVFVTSHLKYAVDSFALSIFRYVPKQEIQPRLEQALNDAFKYIKLQQNDIYTIQTQNRFEKIFLNLNYSRWRYQLWKNPYSYCVFNRFTFSLSR